MKALNKTTIGIIGGAGPMASCLLNQYLVELCQKNFGCAEDSDFPTIINFSFPFSSMITRSSSTSNRAQITEELDSCVNELERNRSLVHRHSV